MAQPDDALPRQLHPAPGQVPPTPHVPPRSSPPKDRLAQQVPPERSQAAAQHPVRHSSVPHLLEHRHWGGHPRTFVVAVRQPVAGQEEAETPDHARQQVASLAAFAARLPVLEDLPLEKPHRRAAWRAGMHG